MGYLDPLYTHEAQICDLASGDDINLSGTFYETLIQHMGVSTRDFLRTGQTQYYDQGDILLSHVSENTECYDLVSGVTALSKTQSAQKKQIISFTFGTDIIPLFEAGSGYEIRALTPITVVKYSLVELNALIPQCVKLGEMLWTYQNKLFSNQARHIYTIGQRNALERVAFFLLEIYHRQREIARNSLVISHPITRRDIANYLGITIETTSRCFSQLKREGLIDYAKSRETEILRFGALQSLLG